MLGKRDVSFLVIMILLFVIISKYIYQDIYYEKNTNAIDNYYSYSQKNDKYIAILEIPNISLKKGLYDIGSKYNTVDYSIQILEQSIMPDRANSILFLAAHSGNSNISFFNDLENLNIGDEIFLYYKNKKYIYQITSCYLEKKIGSINVPNKEKSLILTTCSQQYKGYQFIVLADLIDIK